MGTEISRVRLKSGSSLRPISPVHYEGVRSLLKLSKLLPVELCALLWDVDPEAAMSADGGCPFNRKPDNYGRITLGGQVDVPSSDIRAPIILERE